MSGVTRGPTTSVAVPDGPTEGTVEMAPVGLLRKMFRWERPARVFWDGRWHYFDLWTDSLGQLREPSRAEWDHVPTQAKNVVSHWCYDANVLQLSAQRWRLNWREERRWKRRAWIRRWLGL